MSSEPVIQVENLGKLYQIYAAPQDRLKQSIVPRLQRLASPVARLVGRTTTPRQYFREFWALRDITFNVKAGETVGIIGANGSGKSTLLQLICGTLSPTTGRAEARGRVGALLELGSGFNPEFTGRENIYLNATLLGLSRDEIDSKFDDILAFADIGEFVEQPVKIYSSGMGVRLAFAVMAHIDADVLIIDEALSVGDAYFQQKCMRWLRNFRERGTILFCSHDTGTVINLCDRAIWLDRGEIRNVGQAKEVCENYLATMYARSMGLSDNSVRTAKSLSERSPSVRSNVELTQHITVFEFNEDSAWLGTGDATITNVRMIRSDGCQLGLIAGGEEVQIIVDILANREINCPIVGFHIKDRLGQPLFGDNTFLKYRDKRIRIAARQRMVARFTFELPFLQSGDYSINTAIASGTIENHIQHHRMHDALIFNVSSPFRNGVMIAIPMQSMVLETQPDANAEPSTINS